MSGIEMRNWNWILVYEGYFHSMYIIIYNHNSKNIRLKFKVLFYQSAFWSANVQYFSYQLI